MESNISMQQLKQQRLTPAEKFVLDTIKGVKPSKPDKFGNILWWLYKDGQWLFKQNFKCGDISVNFFNITTPLIHTYNLKNKEITQLLTKLLYKYTNNGQLKIKI
jgi:hypothetical protein